MSDNKIESYIGFCIRSRKIVLGVNALGFNKKPVYLLLQCKSAAKNTVKEAQKFKERLRVNLYEIEDLSSLVYKENCKLCAITDKSLAEAIENRLNHGSEKSPTIGGSQFE